MSRLVIIGRGVAAERLCELGDALGYTEIRLTDGVPELRAADHVVVAEDDARRAEDLLIMAASHEPAPAYLGLAARPKDAQRALVRLCGEHLPADRLDRVRAPAGVDVGAEEPAELAIAVAAELVALRRRRAAGEGANVAYVGEPKEGN